MKVSILCRILEDTTAVLVAIPDKTGYKLARATNLLWMHDDGETGLLMCQSQNQATSPKCSGCEKNVLRRKVVAIS